MSKTFHTLVSLKQNNYMVIKTALKVLLVGVLLYGGWYCYEMVNAWLGIAIIGATFTGLADYVEYGVRKAINNDKQ